MSDGSDSISLSELDSHLFGCAGDLRGTIDSGKYKDYVLPLVFYAAVDKRYTATLKDELRSFYEDDEDVLEAIDETENLVELSELDSVEDGIEEVARQNARDEFLGIRIPAEHSWVKIRNTNKGIASRIDEAFAAFETENDAYGDVFQNDFTNVPSFTDPEEGDDTLNQVINRINGAIYDSDKEIPADVMGEAYMNLVRRFSEADAGEYFTTPRVVRLMVQLLEPFERGSRFHDPTAGSGGMLVEAAEQIKRRWRDGDYGDTSGREFDFINANFEFTGQERNPTVAGIAKMNLALHDLEGEVARGDSLSNPHFTTGSSLEQFDYILANFPFSESGWKGGAQDRQEKYGDLDWTDSLPHGSYGDFAFVMHMESHLADTGQLATVIPHGVLFRNGDKEYREYLIENDLIEAIIGLPENLFENTGIPSGILVLNKDKPNEREGEVLFINAAVEDRFFKDTGDDRNKLIDPMEDADEDSASFYGGMNDPVGIAEIKQKFDGWKSEERVSRVVSTEEIRENDHNLNIALYVDTTEPQEPISVEDTLADIHGLETEYESLDNQLTTYMTQLNYEGETDD